MISLIVYSVVCTIFPSIPRADLRKAHGTLTRMVCHRVGDKPHTALFCDLLHNCRFSDARRADQENGTLLPERNQWKTNFISCKVCAQGFSIVSFASCMFICSLLSCALFMYSRNLSVFDFARCFFVSCVQRVHSSVSSFLPILGQDSFFRSV